MEIDMADNQEQGGLNRGLGGYEGTTTGIPVTLSKEVWQCIADFIGDNKDEIERDTPETESQKAIDQLFATLEQAGLSLPTLD
jgi:hypothetical protein